jgi:hypothetical protein
VDDTRDVDRECEVRRPADRGNGMVDVVVVVVVVLGTDVTESRTS